MNQNAERIKTALKGYKEKREAADARIKQIRELYGEEAAQHEAERQNKTLKAARATVEETIRAAHGEGRRAAEAWGTLDGSKLTDDIKLLDAGLVDREAFNGLKTRYKDNATMLSALRKYGEKKNAEAAKEIREGGDAFTAALSEPFEVRDIPTAADKANRWDKAKASALDMLDAMDGAGKYANPHDWGAAFTKAAMPEMLEGFGENL